MRFTRVVATLPVGMMVFCAGIVCGQDFPNKPIRIIATEAGGSGDFVARVIVQGISGPLGQPVIVENILTTRAGDMVARATPDGYTLLIQGNGFWLSPLLQKMPYDPVKEFSPITLTNNSPNILAVHPSVPVNSVKELIALAKAKPGQLNFATTSPSGAIRLAAELLKSMAGVNIVGIPYSGTGSALTALISGEVQVMFPPAGIAAPHVKSGKLKALAITSLQPSMLAPGLPTVAATLPGYESGNTNGIFAPAKTPEGIINRLHQEIVRVLNRPDVKEKFFSNGSEIVGSSPKEFADRIQSDIARIGKVIKDAGIKAE